jgi:hypothetical protein
LLRQYEPPLELIVTPLQKLPDGSLGNLKLEGRRINMMIVVLLQFDAEGS